MKKTYQTGAFILFDTFVQHGIEHIFGYPGGAILPIYDELFFWEKSNLIKHILVRHEQCAAHAADAYSRASKKIGVCFATSGPGATNLVTGIATAQMDSIPLIIITGQVSKPFIGTDAFQETDIFGITLPIVKHSYIVKSADQINQIITEALYLAQIGRPGPILIDIPKDIGLEKVENYSGLRELLKTKKKHYNPQYSFNKKIIKAFLELIKSSSQPLLYVGGGILRSQNCQKVLFNFISKFNIPTTNTLMGKGSIDENNNFALGMLGMHGTAYANFSVSECDLLLAFGARFDDRVTGKLDEFACGAKVIHIDIDTAEIGKNRLPQLPIVGDLKKTLKNIIKEQNLLPLFKPQIFYWLTRIRRWKNLYNLNIPQNSKLSPQKVIKLIGIYFPDGIFSTDVGQHQMWSAQFLNLLPNHWLSSSGLGTMGYGLPAAIGASFAENNKNKPIICITGDSSFQMCLQELAVVKQYNLPIKIFIINNAWQGMVRQWQQSFYEGRYSHSYMQENLPNFELLAKSYGLQACTIRSEKDFLKLLQNEKNSQLNNSILVDIKVLSDENCYPMVSPGKSNSQMIGITEKK